MRHLPLNKRSFRDTGKTVAYKTRCGLHRADLGTYPKRSAFCPRCFTAEAQGYDFGDGELSVDRAVAIAKHLADAKGVLGQHVYFSLARRLPNIDRAEFGTALSANQIRVRTGAVNVVDEPAPAAVPDATDELFNGIGLPPGEQNDDLDGATNTLTSPMRTEGEKQATPSGWNLEDLTAGSLVKIAGMKASLADVLELFNEGLSIEFSQAIRYRFYAESVLAPYRESIAGDFLDHADEEDEHAQWLMRRITALGGEPEFQVDPPEFIKPTRPDAVQAVLEEVFLREQEGIDFYIRLRDALGDDPTVHIVEDTLVTELEHLDDLARMARLFERTGALDAADQLRSDPALWSESYTDDNASEGIDRMGSRTAAVQRWQRRADAVKRKTRVGEIPVHIEWNSGETRKGVGANGPWERVMSADYGFIPDTVGSDNEPIDVYVGGYPQSRDVYVVNQLHPDGAFDEEKVMLAFQSPQEAEAIYRSHYPENGRTHFGGMTRYSMDEFMNSFVRPPSDAGYIPTIFMQKVKRADHGPGDADGCGSGEGGGSEPAGPKPAPAKPKPAPAPKKAPVDTSPVHSPAEQVMKSDPGRAKQLHDQLWRLLSGPGMNAWASLEDVSAGDIDNARLAIYDSPDHGALGDPDPPQEENVSSGN